MSLGDNTKFSTLYLHNTKNQPLLYRVRADKVPTKRRQAMLHLNLLGTPEIYQDDQLTLRFRTRKAQALLIYLAVTERRWSRDSLATLFWPETDDTTARKNLRDILPTLRRQLGDYLLFDEETIELDPASQYKCDVSQFSTVLEQGLQSVDSDTLVGIMALYRGEFLEDYATSRISTDFELWTLRERERLHQLALMGFTTLCRRQQESGAVEAALTTNRQLLKLVPWNEAAHRGQMLLLAQSGQQAAALDHFESCRQILADELDVEPDAETVALYAQILTGTFNTAQQPRVVEQRVVASAIDSANIPLTPNRAPADTTSIPNNLLASLAVFVGRQHELTSIRERLATSTCRLLTIVGPGGMGKSSLALAVGQQLLATPSTDFPDGIFWVPLAELSAASAEHNEQTTAENQFTRETILRAIAAELSLHAEIRLSSSQQLHTYLRPRRLLLILDNLEHLLAGIQALVTLLAQAPQLKILVTSRARLNLRGEHLLVLDKLSLPAVTPHGTLHPSWISSTQTSAPITEEAWRASEAMSMFVQRAQQLDPDFTINAETIGPVVAICQLVGGLPLGIELATSMLPLLSCDELMAELTAGLDFLQANTYDLPKEQRTLQAVFERSWCLLPHEAQQLLARLAIFPGSFDRRAAIDIADASHMLLKRLIDQSLVSKIGKERYTLHRTVHLFAQQKLQQWPEQIDARHVQYAHFYLAFLAGKEEGLFGAAYEETMTSIQADLDNVHIAWRWAVTHQMYGELDQALTALAWFHEQRGFFSDGGNLYEDALCCFLPIYEDAPHQPIAEVSLLIGRLKTWSGAWQLRRGRFSEAIAAFESSWTILQENGNPAAAAMCLLVWGKAIAGHNAQRSKELFTECLRFAQASGAEWLQALAYQTFGESNFLFGNYAEAETQITKGYNAAKQIHWLRGLTSGQKALGRLDLACGRYCHAEQHLRASIELSRQYHFSFFYLESMIALGEALRFQGHFVEARSCFVESRKVVEKLGAVVFISPILWEEGCLAEQCGEYEMAKELLSKSLTIGLPNWWVHALPTLGWALIGLGEVEEAHAYFQKVLTDAEAHQRLPISLDAQAGLAYLMALQADGAQPEGSESNKRIAQAATTFQQILQHPAATQQTRDRIAALATGLNLSLAHATHEELI